MFMARALATGACAVGLLAACTSAPMPHATTESQPPVATSAPAGLDPFHDQQLAWEDCDEGFECADLTVPLDYDDPGRGDTSVALLRTVGEKPLGSLVVNPGGPGGSGVDYARAAGQIFSGDITDAYQIVGFDPRGVGRSHPVDCLTDKQLDRWIAFDGDPQTPRAEQELLAAAKTFGKRCQRESGDVLPFVDTESVVRDMDVLLSLIHI